MNNIIGLDIGGTNIHGILMREDGKIIKKHKFESNANKSKYEIIKNIISAIEILKEGKTRGIGLGIAGVVDKDGKFLFNPNIPKLKNVNLKEIIKKRFKIRVIQENDANCFAIAEHAYGSGKGNGSLVGLIIGTGVGGGIILDNKLYKGMHGFAGEFGHSVIDPNGPKCNCRLRGDFESLCSGPSIVKRYYSAGGKIRNAEPEKIFNSNESVAKSVIRDTIKYLGIGISHIVNAFDIGLIVLGGGVSNLNFYDEVNESVKEFSNPAVRKNIKVVKNKLGDFSGAVGAARIA